jgi:hypothetical protein
MRRSDSGYDLPFAKGPNVSPHRSDKEPRGDLSTISRFTAR